MRRRPQVVEIDGHFFAPWQAFNGLQNKLVQTGMLPDHPDMSSMYHASKILMKLENSELLSNKTRAIIAYEKALIELYKYTIDEEE